MELLRTTALMFQLHLTNTLRSKRALICLLLALVPPGIAFMVATFADGGDATSDQIVSHLSWFLSLQIITPIIALIAGSAVVTEEVENRTITFIFTRPIPRASLLLGRWGATLVLVSILVGGSAAGVVAMAAGADGELPDGLAARFILAGILGGAVYSLGAAVLGVFMQKAMVVGLGYVFALEGLVANIPGSTQALSVLYYLRSVLFDPDVRIWAQEEFSPDTAYRSPAEAGTRLVLVLVFLLVVGSVGISRKQYVLTS